MFMQASFYEDMALATHRLGDAYSKVLETSAELQKISGMLPANLEGEVVERLTASATAQRQWVEACAACNLLIQQGAQGFVDLQHNLLLGKSAERARDMN